MVLLENEKKNIFFAVFPVAGMRKKMVKKKKKQTLQAGLLPILMLSHDTMHCIVIGMARRQRTGVHHNMAQQAMTRPLLGHDTARWPTIRRAVRAAESWVAI